MRAARFYGPGHVKVEEILEPEPKVGQLKVKVFVYFDHECTSHFSQTIFYFRLLGTCISQLYMSEENYNPMMLFLLGMGVGF